MAIHRLIPILLASALVLIDLVLARVVQLHDMAWPAAVGVSGLAAVFAQLPLVAAVLVWSRWNLVARLLCALSTCYLLACLARVYTANSDPISTWFAVLLAYGAVLSLILLLARYCRLSPLAGQALAATAAPSLTVWQFSIWGLLSTTTGLAMLLAVAQWADFSIPNPISAIIFFFAVATNACIAFFATFHLARAWQVVLVVGVAAAATGRFLKLTHLPPGDDGTYWLSAVQTAVLVGSIAILRISGYRMRRVGAPDVSGSGRPSSA